MKDKIKNKLKLKFHSKHLLVFCVLVLSLFSLFFLFPEFFKGGVSYVRSNELNNVIPKVSKPVVPPLDIEAYNKKINELANNPPPPKVVTKVVKDPTTGFEAVVIVEEKPVINLWPVQTVYPNAGVILPFNRIIAYYGNLYSKKMGVLGEYAEDDMLSRLDAEVKKWKIADPATPVIPALHYIAVVAQAGPGEDGKYRLRMPDSEIEKVLAMAERAGAIVFLDIQVGFSDLQTEVPYFEKYLKLPHVHLGVDPEFSMKTGIRPGKIVGTLDAQDINFAIDYLSKIVKENDLPPKVLVVHRYTQKMLTNYHLIQPSPETQVVMHMDGWGGAAKKRNTYQQFVYKEPVQFTGFKLFYKNDILTPGTTLMKPEDLLQLRPVPIYIQYQ